MSTLFIIDDERGHTDLASEKNVLAGLRHRAIGGGHHEDCAVHLSCAGDHVLDVVGVAGAVHVRVVAFESRIPRGRSDRDAASLFFGGLVDLIVGGEGWRRLTQPAPS